MVTPTAGFAPGVDVWRRGLPQVRNQVRQELVARQLAAHLPPPAPGRCPSALDLGCGQGTQAIRLARAGYEVIGVDRSAELLAEAEAAASREPPEVQQRLHFRCADLFQSLPDARDAPHAPDAPEQAKVVCCHGVAMYLPSLAEGIAAVMASVLPDGLVSVLTRNRASIAMRAGMMGDWAGARAGFDARKYRNRLGLDEVRADETDEVATALEQAGGERIAWYGVRLFTDHWGDVDLPDDATFDELVEAEEEAGRRDPYRAVAALTHTIGVRRAR